MNKHLLRSAIYLAMGASLAVSLPPVTFAAGSSDGALAGRPVSYTHLTLPTILRV